MKTLHTYLVAFMLLVCLPVQALAVAVMPVCHALPVAADSHASMAIEAGDRSHCADMQVATTAQASTADTQAAHAHDGHAYASSQTTQPAAPDQSKQQTCDHCASCAANASYGVLTIAQPLLSPSSVAHAAHAYIRHYPTVISQPFHPPRLA